MPMQQLAAMPLPMHMPVWPVEPAREVYEQSFRLLFAGHSQPMWVYDRQTLRFLDANEAAVACYGYSREEFLAMRITDIRPSEDLPRFVEYLREQRASLRGSGRWRHRLKDGRIIDVEVTAHALAFAAREAVLVSVSDVSARMRAEMALNRSEEQYRRIVETAQEGIWLLDTENRTTFVNQKMAEMLGYSVEEMLGAPLWGFLEPDLRDQALREIANRRDGTPAQVERRFRHRDGRTISVLIANSVMFDPDGRITGLLGMISDITARKQAEEQRERQLQRLAALRTIDKAISGVLDLHLTLCIILDRVTEQLGVDAATVLRLNPEAQMLECVAERGFRDTAAAWKQLRVGEGSAGRAALDRTPISVPDLRQEQDARQQLVNGEQFISYFASPLIVEGQVKGVLELFHRAPLSPEPEWLEFLEALSGQVAVAIKAASLFEDLQRSNTELVLAYDTTIEGWSRALDLRDKETKGHSRRVTDLTMSMARTMGLSDEVLVHVRRGALLHDIGKMGIPDRILLKPGLLSEEEWLVMRNHPDHAYTLLSPIAYLRPALDIPYCHHEKWDGTGYPRGLQGEQIPLAARIFAVADVWDALRSDRPYRAPWPEAKVREHIRALAGSHFDPQVVAAFLAMDAAPSLAHGR